MRVVLRRIMLFQIIDEAKRRWRSLLSSKALIIQWAYSMLTGAWDTWKWPMLLSVRAHNYIRRQRIPNKHNSTRQKYLGLYGRPFLLLYAKAIICRLEKRTAAVIIIISPSRHNKVEKLTSFKFYFHCSSCLLHPSWVKLFHFFVTAISQQH